MNNWKNAALAALAALVMAFGGAILASYGSRVEALESGEKDHGQRISGVEGKLDIIIQQNADMKQDIDDVKRELRSQRRR